MRSGRAAGVVVVSLVSLLAAGCMPYLKAPTPAWLNEARLQGEVQAEVTRLLALKPSAPLPSRLVIYEIGGPGESKIASSQKWLELRKATAENMKKALDKAELFQEVKFLPAILLPPGEQSDLNAVRIGAARVHADGVLVFTSASGDEYQPNLLAVFYPTIIGLFVAPGSRAGAMAVSKAVLVDVPTGYIYTVSETYAQKSAVRPYALLDRESLELAARTEAITALAEDVAAQAKKLKAGQPVP